MYTVPPTSTWKMRMVSTNAVYNSHCTYSEIWGFSYIHSMGTFTSLQEDVEKVIQFIQKMQNKQNYSNTNTVNMQYYESSLNIKHSLTE